MKKVRAIFIPGNQGGTPRDNWFPWLKRELEKMGIKVINKDFPDNHLARAKYWLPFLKKLGADETTILVGHSSGAVAAMRYAQENKILGSVLVGACYTDLGDELEKKSGYYNKVWSWKKIRDNQEFIVQFAACDDPWIPIKEARAIHKNLKTEYYEFKTGGHFGGDYYKSEFPEIIRALKNKLKK